MKMDKWAQRICAMALVIVAATGAGWVGISLGTRIREASPDTQRVEWMRSCVRDSINARGANRDVALAWCRDMRQWFDARDAEGWR